MERYLLFDSSCTTCSKIAAKVKNETNGRIVARSLHDGKIKEILDQARPGWRWEPTLIEINGDTTRVYTGFHMRLRFIAVLGFRRAWSLAEVIQSELVSSKPSSDRRDFLGTVTKWAFMLGISSIVPIPDIAFAQTQGKRNPNEPGAAVKALGVAAYKQVIQDTASVRVLYEAKEPGQDGIVQISRVDKTEEAVLIRGNDKLVVTMKPHRIEMIDASGRAAGFSADWDKREWVPDDDNSSVVLKDNMRDFQFIGAISADLTADFTTTHDAETGAMSVAPDYFCPCSIGTVRGFCVRTTKSMACQCATNDTNVLCSNQWCIGCCKLYDCDCICLAGDYGCECGRFGGYCTDQCTD